MLKASILSLALVMPTFASTISAERHTLTADGKTDTYLLISKSGFYAETSENQTPDNFMGHPEYHHISQIFDNTLGKYVFAFDIHIDYKEGNSLITDGNKGTLTDRQRNEIKCMSSRPATVAEDGETITYRWKFMLPQGMQTTSAFCHIHQIKGMGDSEAVAHPVFTLTCRTAGNRQVLQLINVPYEGSANVTLSQIDLQPLLGRWIEAKETLTVGHKGKYALTLTDVETGLTMMKATENDIEIWRDTDDRSTMRGKWGIYRSLGDKLSLKGQLRSERILFADFEITKDEKGASVTEKHVAEPNNGIIYDLSGKITDGYNAGIIIRNGKKILKQH